MNNDTNTLPRDLSEIMPCLNRPENWQEAVPATLREPAQQIAESTGESFETVLATVFTFFGAQLRRRHLIYDYRGKPVPPELNLLVARPGKAISIPWYETLCNSLLTRDSYENSLLRIGQPGEAKNINGRDYVAREHQVLSELLPYGITRKLSPEKTPAVILNSTATALTDELDRLTRFEKKELARILKLSWANDRIGCGKEAFTGGVSLLWDIDCDEMKVLLPVFFQTTKPAPVLLLDSVANSEKPPAESLNALLSLQDDIWECAQGQIMEIAPCAESEEQLLSFVNAFNVQIEQVPSAAARRNLGLIPGLCYRLLPLLAIFADREEEDLIIAAKGMSGALARRHFSTLHRFTAGFTAEPLRAPDNPAEVLAEYQLLAKIDKHAPMTRTKLNAMHSNDNRKVLDIRLSRLIRDGRVAVDDRGRFSVRSMMSV